MSKFDFSCLYRDPPSGMKVIRADYEFELKHVATGRRFLVQAREGEFLLSERGELGNRAFFLVYRSPDLYRVLRLLGYGKFPKAVRTSTGKLKFEAMK